MIRGDVRVRVIFNHLPETARAVVANAERIVAAAALDIVAGTQHNIVAHDLIDTGAMLNSVRAEHGAGPAQWLVIVGQEYGIYHELGTRWLPARPFLGPAANAVRPLFRAAMANVANR